MSTKKTKNIFILKLFILTCLFFFSLVVSAGALALEIPSNPSTLVPCGLNGAADCTLCHLIIGFQNIYNYILFYVLFPATFLVIVVAGVMYMVSSGDKGMIEKAKSALTYALTAMILALTAWLIINATLSALGYKKVDNWYTFSCDTTQTVAPTITPGTGNPNPGTGTGNTGGTGCAAVVNNVKSMTGWTYTSKKNGNEGLRMTNGYGDCSSTTSRAYTNAGCKDPGQSTSVIAGKAGAFSDASSLKAGDALVWNNGKNGHVGICLDDGCTQIMGASTKGGIRPSGGGSQFMVGQAARAGATLKVIKVSDYCPASSC